MKRTIFCCVIALAACKVAASDAGQTANLVEASDEECAVLVESASGQVVRQVLPSLHVQSLNADEPFVLPVDAPANAKAIQCTRGELIPKHADYKVLAAGYPFAIAANGRVGILTVLEGRVRFNMLVGEMTEPEIQQVGAVLDQIQKQLLELERSTPGT
jgi:hypothetical protein